MGNRHELLVVTDPHGRRRGFRSRIQGDRSLEGAAGGTTVATGRRASRRTRASA